MVKCRDCGFVGTYADSGSLLEVVSEIRTGRRFQLPSLKLVCVKKACDFEKRADEIEKSVGEMYRQQSVERTLHVEIDCTQYCQWIPGLDPKEHLKMDHYDRMEERAEKRLQDDKNWRNEQSRKSEERIEQRRNDDREWQIKQKKNDRLWTFFTFVVSAIFTLILTRYFGIHRDGTPIQP